MRNGEWEMEFGGLGNAEAKSSAICINLDQ